MTCTEIIVETHEKENMSFVEGQGPQHQNLLSWPSQPSQAWAARFHWSPLKDVFSLEKQRWRGGRRLGEGQEEQEEALGGEED